MFNLIRHDKNWLPQANWLWYALCHIRIDTHNRCHWMSWGMPRPSEFLLAITSKIRWEHCSHQLHQWCQLIQLLHHLMRLIGFSQSVMIRWLDRWYINHVNWWRTSINDRDNHENNKWSCFLWWLTFWPIIHPLTYF